MSNCAMHRLVEVAVGFAIVLLVTLLVILWTGLSHNSSSGSNINQHKLLSNNASVTHATDQIQNQIPGARSEEDVKQQNHYQNEVEDSTWRHWKGDILPKAGIGDYEFIVLAKINHNSYEDPLEQYSKIDRHQNAHLWSSQNKVWDPHPQYKFEAFGYEFHLSLKEDSSFVPPSVTVTHISKNTTRHEYSDQHLGCFYNGYVEGDPKSFVAVSLCHGMTGHMRTSTGNYLIKPTENWTINETLSVGLPLQHVIYRLSKIDLSSYAEEDNHTVNDLLIDDNNNSVENQRECALIDNESSKESNTEIVIDNKPNFVKTLSNEQAVERRQRRATAYSENDNSSFDEDGDRSFALESDVGSYLDIYGSWRTRRALPRKYFIEMMVVADAKMIKYHGPNLTDYIFVLMNTVSRIYKDPSIGNPISIAVIKIKLIDEIFGVKQRDSDGIEAADMLKKFCHWQKLHNPHEPSPEHHDTALLLTRESLCQNSSHDSCNTLGLAELGRMCSIDSSCAIVQDNGLATAFTIAHEIGHVLNMPHDDDRKCTKFSDRSGLHNIMSRMLDEYTMPWEWSKCSRHYITEFLDAGLGNCLLDEPRSSKIMSRSHGSRLPGEDYSEDKQCELVFGAGSEICPHMVSDVCKKLWCTVPNHQDQAERCHTLYMPWADGTVCGPGKWCHRGECVSRENLEPVDGQWGEWGSYGECSRTCGGGIKKKYRECDSPAPKNGGNYCLGERVRYRSCSTKECPPGSIDFREEQCAVFDNDNRNLANLTKNVRWHPKYTGILAEDRCKLHCQDTSNQHSIILRDKVIDGTPCGPDTFHICVNGHCKPAGCDHMLNSTAELDSCGVCRGDNSTCQRISGSYNSSEYGYTRITKIPAGSNNIDIRQYGWKGSYNDSNYLALRLKEGGKYILNGNYTVIKYRKVIIQPGVRIEYSGGKPIIERLNSSRPIHVDLILEVLCVGNPTPPQITYEYTVPKKILERYTWMLSDWTTCDRMCQGITYRQALCTNAESKDIVSEDYCTLEERPREDTRSCNTHCELQWQEVPNSKSECSSHCGPGTMIVKYRCMQFMSRSSSIFPRPVPPRVCNHLEHPKERRPCIGPCEYAHWQYSEWSSCSVTCGDNGFQERAAHCVDAENRLLGDDKCNANEKISRRLCEHKSCPKWDFGDWTPCSVSCGIGKRERNYWCRIDNRVVHHSNCKDLLDQPVMEACDAGPCVSWHTGDWSSCSATCGNGIRRRVIKCKYVNGTLSQDCDSLNRPISTISCALEPCPKPHVIPVTYSSSLPVDELVHENEVDNRRITFRSGYVWNIEGFEECSKSCGGGFTNQIIRCISVETGKMAPHEEYCDSHKRPQKRIACNEHQCPIWTTGGWNQCDVKCGDGYQHRQVLCQDLRGEIMNDSDCSEKTRPRHVRKCQKPPCVSHKNSYNSKNIESYKWRTGVWSECSASCGVGIRRREVTCHRINGFGWQDPTATSGCPLSEKPINEQPCKARGCNDQFHWVAGNWRKCSHTCGRKGRQIRRLFCLDQQGKKVRRRHCPANLRPQRKRKCNIKPCTGPTSCLEVQSRLKTNLDGEYILFVGGRYMSIYCYDMKSYEPQEYLTLPTGERENYAEIYDKRLRDPNSCPYHGRRNDSCECMSESATISGRTMFKRIRINIHTLHIIADDFKFSMKMGKNNVEYGKAGDCYSQMDCPQGRFGINLSGTLLMLSSDVHWPKQKNSYSVINKINNQRIIGKCGGYCGFCTPSPGLKLNVLPP